MEVMTTSYILGTCLLFIIGHFLKELRPAVNGKTFGEKRVDLHEWTGAIRMWAGAGAVGAQSLLLSTCL